MARDGGVPYDQRTLDCNFLPAPRVALTAMMERAPGNAKAWSTKLNWPPTPLTTRPSSRPSETTAPSKVAIMALLTKRALTRAAFLPVSSP